MKPLSFLGVIDHPRRTAFFGEDVEVKGWVVSDEQDSYKIAIEINGRRYKQFKRFARPDVNESTGMSKVKNPKPGFRTIGKVKEDEDVIHVKLILMKGEDEQILFENTVKRLRDANLPRILFVHIPKTGGTTVNRFFENLYPSKQTVIHLESAGVPLPDAVGTKLFSSGHINYAQYEKQFDLKDYLTMTVLRDPIDQLLSHLTWVHSYGMPQRAKEFERLSDVIKQIVCRINSIDIDEFLETMTEPEIKLFENSQTKYLVEPELYSQKHAKLVWMTALSTLAKIDFVGVVEQLSDFLPCVGESLGISREDLPKINFHNQAREPYLLKRGDFQDAVRAKIWYLTRYDRMIYPGALVLMERQKIKTKNL